MQIKVEYFGPHPGSTFPRVPPKPKKSKTSGAASTTSAATPGAAAAPDEAVGKAFFEKYLTSIKSSPLSSTATLTDATKKCSDQELLRAFLGAGYGPKRYWNKAYSLTPVNRRRLREFLWAKGRLLSSSFERSLGKPLDFYRVVEPSEKTVVSYLAGSFGAYIGAEAWLSAAGRSIDLFAHASLLTQGSLVTSTHGPIKPTDTLSKQMPDYAVLDNLGEWHIFEAKGGVENQRWKTTLDGLRQLQNVRQIGGFQLVDSRYFAPATPRTSVCCHTTVEKGKPVRLMVVDPPDAPSEASAPDANLQPGHSIFVSVDSCRLMQWVDMHEWAELLEQRQPGSERSEDEQWLLLPGEDERSRLALPLLSRENYEAALRTLKSFTLAMGMLHAVRPDDAAARRTFERRLADEFGQSTDSDSLTRAFQAPFEYGKAMDYWFALLPNLTGVKSALESITTSRSNAALPKGFVPREVDAARARSGVPHLFAVARAQT